MASAVRIMVAGVDKDARGAVEASVRRALGPLAGSGAWLISVVGLAGKWSVTLDGPGEGLRGVSFVAERSRLADAIRQAVEGGNGAPTAPPPVATATAKPGAARATSSAALAGAPRPASPAAARPAPPGTIPAETRDRHICEHCGGSVLVVYERRPGEPMQLVRVACPHCWKLGHAEVGAWAAAGGDYRAEKA
jgi:hypothetical protein